MANRIESKIPFYDIEVFSADGKRNASLTDTIKRLIDSITISDNLTNSDGASANELRITFKQHDYLPQDGALRPQSPRYFGELTNRPGAVLDLRFDSEKGFTFVSKEEMESGTTTESRTQSKASEPVVFVFQEGNLIDITWGYLEPLKTRKRRFKISQVIMSGGTSGDGTVEVICFDITNDMQNAVPKRGVTFEKNQKKESLKAVLFRVSNAFNAQLRFDGEVVQGPVENIGTEIYDRIRANQKDSAPPDRPFVFHSDTNAKDFINRLAREYESYVKIDYDETTQKYIVDFRLSADIFEKPSFVFNYKDSSGDVLNYNIQSFQGLINSDTSTIATNDNGAIEREEYIPLEISEPSIKVPAPEPDDIKNKFEDNIGSTKVGKSEVLPTEKEEAVIQFNQMNVFAAAYKSNITMTTVGDPDYTPALITLNNVGARYSGDYRIFQVIHKISSAGYTCAWNGKRFIVGEGGVAGSTTGNEESKTDKVNLRIAESNGQ
jgi:hypothetical protein